MPTPQDLKHAPSEVLARLHDFFSNYVPKVKEDQPWVDKQLHQITDEMASRPAMKDKTTP